MKENNLDLHGIRHAEVFQTVDKFVGGHIMSDTKCIEIVTGNSPKMKEIVSRILLEYGLTFHSPPYNKGMLIVNII